MPNPIFLLCDVCESTASFTKLPSKLKRFIKDSYIPNIPTSSIKNIDWNIKEGYPVIVNRLSQPLKSDRGKNINIKLYQKEILNKPQDEEIRRTVRASKYYITPPIVAKTDKGFIQMDGGRKIEDVRLTPKQAYKIGDQIKRLEKRAANIGLYHKDLHGGNIVINKKRNKVSFIDWADEGVLSKPSLYNINPKTTKYLQKGYET